MENYDTIKINENEYYLSNDIYDFSKSFFYGTGNNIRNIINKKKIDDTDYIFAYQKKGEWIVSTIKYCRAKLLLSREWCIDNVPKFAKHSTVVAELEELPQILELDDDQKFTDGTKTD